MPRQSLSSLAKVRFPDIESSPAELRLIEIVQTSEVFKLGNGLPWISDSDNADVNPQAWGHERDIRAKVIRWLCVNQEVRALLDPKGIQLYGARHRIPGSF